MTPPTVEPSPWLVQTKLYPPRLRDDIVLRPHLFAALTQAIDDHALTLISAPPGYGKTTLLATPNLFTGATKNGTHFITV